MSNEKATDIITLFHSMLVAYQIALRDILGTGRAVFVCPVLENFAKINKTINVHMVKKQSLDESLQNLSKSIKASGLVRDFRYEKLSAQKYIVNVEKCIWAPEAHKKLNTKDLLCPLALMAMSTIQTHSGNKVKVTYSEFFEKGTKTRIETIT